tara:strand:+ start:1317 stop:1838 length:522 start_codon:yes stop_codon:yes gene_type:complete
MAKKILIVYSSTDGHTINICKHIYKNLETVHDPELKDLKKIQQSDLENAEIIIIGASIRYGDHSKELYNFVKNHKKIIESKENAFFSVNAVARKPEKNQPETNPYIKKFLKRTSWNPNKMAVFAGKIDYPKYNFFDKHMIRLIMWITKGPTNLSKTYEFTDWSKVDEFIEKIG